MKITRSLRKSISMKVNSQWVLEVKAPLFVSTSKIEMFIQKHNDWIQTQQKNIQEHIKEYKQGELFYYLGNRYPLNLVSHPTKHKLIFTWDEFELDRNSIWDAKELFETFYRSEMKKYMHENLPQIADNFWLKYNRLSVTSAKTRWWSCSSKKNINFTYRLIMAPKLSVDYVIIHELSHLKHMDHSSVFWQHVDRMFFKLYEQDYNPHQNWLKQNGSTLIF